MLLETLFRVFQNVVYDSLSSVKVSSCGQKLVCCNYMQHISKCSYHRALFVLDIFLTKRESFTNEFFDDVFSDYIKYDYVNSLV